MLTKDFYRNPDVLSVSRALLGKRLMNTLGNETVGGIITETEAYRAPEDRASHAYNFRRTKRNEAMYADGGIAYVYCFYGIHALLNVVTNVAEMPHAVLIRAIHPICAHDAIKERRRGKLSTDGTGKVTQALAIQPIHNKLSLRKP